MSESQDGWRNNEPEGGNYLLPRPAVCSLGLNDRGFVLLVLVVEAAFLATGFSLRFRRLGGGDGLLVFTGPFLSAGALAASGKGSGPGSFLVLFWLIVLLHHWLPVERFFTGRTTSYS